MHCLISLSSRSRDSIPAAFVCLVAFVLLTALGRHYLLDAGDPYKCRALLNSGYWLDAEHLRNWQPSSCMIHVYTPNEAQSCFLDRRVVFAGDSMVRETFWAFARLLDSKKSLPIPEETEKHSDVHVTIENTKLDFYWDPYLNHTGFELAFDISDNRAKPAMTVVGTGLWYAKNVHVKTFELWQETISNVVELDNGRRYKKDAPSDLTIIMPLLGPDWTRLREDRKTITPEMLNRMNAYLKELSTNGVANIPLSFIDMLSNVAPDATHDMEGLHLVDAVTSTQAQVLLNLLCNDRLSKQFPFDKTCCFQYPAPNYVQLLFFSIALFIIPIVYLLRSQGFLTKSYLPSEPVLHALFPFGLVLVFAYYTDRTHIFGKESKQFSLEQFCFLMFLTLVIGYLTAKTADRDQPFLNRDQTDEWKGWMQIFILIYHYLGASKVAWIYNFIRVLVAMYLFMTGFGHTIYFYKKADYSFKRVVAVLVRMNLLNVILAYTMDTNYLFYYFSPLVSFWFVIVWITMWVKHDKNSDIRFLGAKMVISAIIVTVLTKTPGVLETLFSLLRLVARINWDAVEWRFRVGLDMWIVYFGMIVAILFIKESDITCLPQWPDIRNISLIASIVTIPLYFLFEATRENKFVYNHWHPYISVFPILAFVVLRNASTRLRNTHSAAFAFIGRCSLETFILQFHIWLAADTKGLLVIIEPSRWRWLSFIFGTAVFLFLSWKVATVTGTITEWIMGNKKKPAPPVLPLEPVAPAPIEIGEKSNDDDIEKAGESLHNGDSSLTVPVMNTELLSFNEKLVRVMGIYWEDLHMRMTVIIVSLWILNMIYP